MQPDPLVEQQVNWAQYEPGQRAGHYESFYQRANHPTRPLAFWSRYTVFSPARRPADAVGELWFVLFNGETGRHVVAKREYPIAKCTFDRQGFSVRIGDATLGPDALAGAMVGTGTAGADTAGADAAAVAWDLAYAGDQPPLYLLPRRLYRGGFPKAKSLVGKPLARYDGELIAGGRRVTVNGWVGSQNHNWGSRHPDRYAFGQVAGFDDAPDSFLEIVTAANRQGPLSTPMVTLLVLRHRGREHSLVTLRQGIRATSRFGYFFWEFASKSDAVRIRGRIEAPAEAFVGLTYPNPPGGIKYCLNTNIARCELEVTDRATGARETLLAEYRALFEILTDDATHGVPIRA
ncbi:hypothetical protein HC028_15065 [Planosporangium flavigriseum]|uniref:Uncharacterized protein n=1 Tax=Planosporangium flavigriseum TaxID=373681 RepID=A0A8J3PKR5_9ACTN|nr:hypothetical protein [Planosporangium flavigriseum]NJC65812.1 hypothetical protein [Planosporangium flavigriseum]GIG73666.1 hypothetical protein Pfl04_20700 [Planosporangium flavigriseum]